MAFEKTETYGARQNILDSEVGLVTKTREATQGMAADDGSRKFIHAGDLYTNPDDEKDIGVVFCDYDMTDYEKYPIAVVVEGRVKKDRVSEQAKAKADEFAAKGLYLV